MAGAEYDRILSAARKVHRMDFTESDSEAHMAASAYMVDQADELWAVWDGEPARGYGGTADVVAYARERHIPVRVIWPDGARRDSAWDRSGSDAAENERGLILAQGVGFGSWANRLEKPWSPWPAAILASMRPLISRMRRASTPRDSRWPIRSSMRAAWTFSGPRSGA